MHLNKLYYWLLASFLISLVACSEKKKEPQTDTIGLGFEIRMPGEVFTTTDTMKYKEEPFIHHTWKSVKDMPDGNKVYYNVILIDYPPNLIHSDSVGMSQVLFSEHEQVYFSNAQYSLVDRADLYKDGYPGSSYLWNNLSDNSYSYNYYYLKENKLYYMMVHIPTWKSEYVAKKDEFINSFKVLK